MFPKRSIALCLLFILSSATSKHKGCTDILADNFDADATKDDGSCTCYTEPEKVYILGVVASPTDQEKVSLKNNSGIAQDLSGWIIGDANNPNAYSIPSGTIFEQSEAFSFSASTMGFGINDSGETIYLKNASGVIVDTWMN